MRDTLDKALDASQGALERMLDVLVQNRMAQEIVKLQAHNAAMREVLEAITAGAATRRDYMEWAEGVLKQIEEGEDDAAEQ